jgi:peptide/nickel transport system substrate-binding protein
MGLGYRDVILTTDQEPYDAMALRQALNWATDRDSIHAAVFFSTGAPAQGPLAPSHFAYDPDFVPYTRDLDRARELLAEAGYEDGFSGSMKVINNPLESQIAQLLQAQWREANIDVELELLDFTTLLEQMRGKQFTALQISWSGRIDPDGNMYPQYISEGAFNDGNYSNTEVDEALNNGRTSLDQEVRTEAYRTAQRLIVEEAAMVFIHHDAIVQAWRPEVQGVEVFADGMLRPASISLEG